MSAVQMELIKRKVIRLDMLLDDTVLHTAHLEKEINRVKQLCHSLIEIDRIGEFYGNENMDSLLLWKDLSEHIHKTTMMLYDLLSQTAEKTKPVLRRIEHEEA